MPKEFDYLVDKNVIFKIQVKTNQIRGFNGTYTVLKLTTDPSVVEKLSKELFECQVSVSF